MNIFSYSTFVPFRQAHHRLLPPDTMEVNVILFLCAPSIRTKEKSLHTLECTQLFQYTDKLLVIDLDPT